MRLRCIVCCVFVLTITLHDVESGRSSSGGRSTSSGRSSSSSSSSSSGRSWGRSSSSSKSSGYGSLSTSIHSSSSSSHGVNSGRITKPTATHHHTSHAVPVITPSRTSNKHATEKPKVYNRNTARPITNLKNEDKIQNTHVSNQQSSRHHNTFSGGGLHHNTLSTGRHNNTFGSGGFHHNTLSTGRHNNTFGSGGLHHNVGRLNATSGGIHHVQNTHISHQQSSKHNTTGGGYNPHLPSAPPLPSPTNPHAPSAPLLPGSPNLHTPSAPPLPGSIIGSQHPPGPGWNPNVQNQHIQNQHVPNQQSPYPTQPPPPYPGGNYPHHAPPPYSGGNYPNHAPPSYPGGNYPNHAPPPYPGGNYPNHAPPPYPGHPSQGVYQPVHYPPPSNLPSPPPGFSPYGVPYYKQKSGIRGGDVIAGLALWELMRSNHRHDYGIRTVHHHHYHDGEIQENSYQPSYHETMRERYTTRIAPTQRNPTGPGAYNILEMTHYITPDDKGVISSSEGNMTCFSVYDARSVSRWHQRQVTDFHKAYPNSTFPLYLSENDTRTENFTVIPGRIIHREPVSITCCGINKGKIDLNLLTNGKHPNVNCVHQVGHIIIKKLTFVRTKVSGIVNTTNWEQVKLLDPNATTPTPLAPFPTNFPLNISTPTPLAPFPNTSTPTPLAPFPSINTLFPGQNASVQMNQTFDSFGIINTGVNETVDMSQVFNSLGSTTESVTSNPNELIVG